LRHPWRLVLDESTNHLDGPSRHALAAKLHAWRRGLIVVSYDRALLGQMERIVELFDAELPFAAPARTTAASRPC